MVPLEFGRSPRFYHKARKSLQRRDTEEMKIVRRSLHGRPSWSKVDARRSRSYLTRHAVCLGSPLSATSGAGQEELDFCANSGCLINETVPGRFTIPLASRS
jgi:hypothetical protein